MNFNVLKTKALSKNQMRAIKGGSGTCGYKSPTGTVKCGVSKAQAGHRRRALVLRQLRIK